MHKSAQLSTTNFRGTRHVLVQFSPRLFHIFVLWIWNAAQITSPAWPITPFGMGFSFLTLPQQASQWGRAQVFSSTFSCTMEMWLMVVECNFLNKGALPTVRKENYVRGARRRSRIDFPLRFSLFNLDFKFPEHLKHFVGKWWMVGGRRWSKSGECESCMWLTGCVINVEEGSKWISFRD